MRTITLIDIRTKKELDIMFKRIDLQWRREQKRIRKLLRNGY